MKKTKIIYKTQSLCPTCMQKIDGQVLSEGSIVFLVKNCPEHGEFKTKIWRGKESIEKWIVKREKPYITNPITKMKKGCPYDCGLCEKHRQNTCTALIEVTQNCNMNCSFCFADSHKGKSPDPSLDEIIFQYKSLMKASGKCNVQLSGGEPTVRDDLDDIIRAGLDAGFEFIQINTNGIRIAEDENYLKGLVEAGLSSVFLQFDGTEDSIYEKLRRRKLIKIKVKAIENCKKFGLGLILVPTLVAGINTHNIGQIIDFALEHLPGVRGVHFQPVSYFGRIPFTPEDKDRLTLSELMRAIELQTRGKIPSKSFKPPT